MCKTHATSYVKRIASSRSVPQSRAQTLPPPFTSSNVHSPVLRSMMNRWFSKSIQSSPLAEDTRTTTLADSLRSVTR
ncbi:hypothetical protein BC629DRAFT_1522018 [Irpex lacteus]|nr:hypothetical protein BC629DRAFT_1522018 [Irpex lacteus]